MRLNFLRRSRVSFYRPRGEFRDVMAAAGRDASASAMDSLDVLTATMATEAGARLARSLGADPAAIRIDAQEARTGREPVPGLTADAKAAFEAAIHHGLVARQNPGVAELLLGLATAECQARAVFAAHGITAERLVARRASD